MRHIFVIALLMVPGSLSSAQTRFYKGNTHIHCYPWSGDIRDSTYTADVVVDSYRNLGYDFIVFTNHGTWFDAAQMSIPTFTIINGSEVGISRNGRWGHFTVVGLDARISGAGLTHQQLIDTINAHGAIPFVNHPRFSQIPLIAAHIIDSMKSGLHHMEMWNAVTISQPPPDDISVWDSVLSTGRLMYGVACDDSHRPAHQGKAWIMVRSLSNRTEHLLAAIRAGDFYGSNGVVLESIEMTPERYSVVSQNGKEIRFIGRNGSVLSTVAGKSGSYLIKGTEGYVRAEVIGESEERAWGQPVMIEEEK